jgi:hypothetical protein
MQSALLSPCVQAALCTKMRLMSASAAGLEIAALCAFRKLFMNEAVSRGEGDSQAHQPGQLSYLSVAEVYAKERLRTVATALHCPTLEPLQREISPR